MNLGNASIVHGWAWFDFGILFMFLSMLQCKVFQSFIDFVFTYPSIVRPDVSILQDTFL